MIKPRISVIIPVLNESENISIIYEEIISVFKKNNNSFEIIFVNDGSQDSTQEEIEKIFKKDKLHIKAIQFRNNFGKASALRAGFQLAKGEIIVTLDGDLQDDPHELPKFIDKIEAGYDLVCGWKKHRKDSFIKNNSSKLFNAFTNSISEVKLHDFNCGFKAYRSEVAKGINLYGELHRYIPVLLASQGYNICEVSIEHRKRKYGKSKYGSQRFMHGFFDLLTVVFITRFKTRPLHFFGYFGLSFFFLGLIFSLYLTYIKLFNHIAIGERPLLLFSIMLMIMGVQIGAIGIVGEQITTVINRNESNYSIKKILQKPDNENNE
ncbi:glycosyltransferase [Candidatus Roizmanbacteria bacterium CG03_land_8_20_14_0_80_36_21]|uniref:Glycosyltransferase n=1 Tax=Candidatus Roizmanbacteria bacterium CG23_combo_of_CG06-09_8_20_14_all_35_49 TaxID=1974863 RepID=A0A2G9Y6B5_9BACT|nr:MAG: glycosyltransferase [Candidatus Roizmanbacteria bacterium CG23_combo_of_CG06-09_8_20_14_all_35_49]PIV08963.1 MAG: glycosyltransferase [Candidatus Roizmanbacteria bacterium CG03_land_8_20_14_0_80_36_21]PJA52774.1 MAG: glycosyltransferase [Candidatus Roizmanbacteria bacterium CG_4_9_14_3_um_filter_36_11]